MNTRKNFRGSYAEMLEISSFKLELISQNIEQFRRFGITETEVEALANKLQNFSDLDSDMQKVVNQVNFRIQKSETVEKLKTEIKILHALAVNVLPTNSDILKTLNIKNLSIARGGKMELMANNIIKTIERNSNVIREITGNNSTTILELSKQLNKFENQHDLAKLSRKQATQLRQAQATEIFNTLIKYCNIGKAIFSYDKALSDSFNFFNFKYQKSKPETEPIQ